MIKYFYITANPAVAEIAQAAGVDRIFVDMEYIGKEKRQPNMDTVKNHHTVNDVKAIRKVVDKAELLVRVNPIDDNSAKEIEDVLQAGADIVMLPMWKTAEDVKTFVNIINGRAKTLLLLETEEARECLDEILKLDGIDEIHIGLNDLHLCQHKKNMFELLVDGVVDEIAEKITRVGIPYGIGGVATVGGEFNVPAENILAEHYRLGSTMAILARAFCNTDEIKDLDEIKKIFETGIQKNREYERFLQTQNDDFFARKHNETQRIIKELAG